MIGSGSLRTPEAGDKDRSMAAQSVQSEVERAEQLVADGRMIDAVDVLMAANRATRDPAIEERLVTLRHAAFAEVEGSPHGREWPPVVPERFPEVRGIPTVTPDQLTAETLGSGILHHGCLHVRGLLSQEWVHRLIDDIDRAFEAHDRWASGTPDTETSPWFKKFVPGPGYKIGKARPFVRAGGGVYTVDSPRTMFDILEAFDEVGVAKAITEHLGERPALSVKKWTLRRVPVLDHADWHQDGAFLGEGMRTVNVWLSLTDCGVDAPGLDIVPFRLDEIVQTGTDGAFFDWSVGNDLAQRMTAERGMEVVRPRFAAGDALLFDEYNLHRTGLDPGMANERYAIESWFFAPSAYPRDQIPVAF
jgi:hypothetical protein